ncbi:MAG: sulfatase-like hydrolase/transferase [Pseudomonadota bacterium]
MTAQPNILLITADQWRGDCLGAAGHPTLRTPNIDALAADGMRFVAHYAGTAPCSPARATLYTGLYQMNHRVVQNGAPLDDRFDNIAQAARRAGYAPTLFGYSDTGLDPRTVHPNDPAGRTYESVLPGFIVRQSLPEDDMPWLAWLASRGHDPSGFRTIHEAPREEGQRVSLAPPSYTADETQTAFLTDAFLRWLSEQRGQPWFAHVSFLRPHPPFVVPAPYNEMFDPADGPPFCRADTAADDAALHPISAGLAETCWAGMFVPGLTGRVSNLAAEDFGRIRALYYGMISEVDAQIGRMLAGLADAGADGDTLVILTSDHGEMMGDRWSLGKGGPFAESYHIPLIIRGPGVARGTVQAPTSAADIFPTLLERLDVAPRHVPDGLTLEPFLAGGTPDVWREHATWEFDWRPLRSAMGRGDHPAHACGMQMLLDGKTLYAHSPGLPPLLLDDARALGRLRNVANDPAHSATHQRLMSVALDHRLAHADRTLADRTVWDEAQLP